MDLSYTETVILVSVVQLCMCKYWRIYTYASIDDGKVAVIIDPKIQGATCFSHIECQVECAG